MLNVGDKVRISDGKPAPPKHHKKKYREWERFNRIGYVFRVEDSCGYVSVDHSPALNSPIVFSYPAKYVSKMED
jgi:hypothetical protein